MTDNLVTSEAAVEPIGRQATLLADAWHDLRRSPIFLVAAFSASLLMIFFVPLLKRRTLRLEGGRLVKDEGRKSVV